jgi:hypothetical protein
VVQVVVEEGGLAVESKTKTKSKHGKAAHQQRLARLGRGLFFVCLMVRPGLLRQCQPVRALVSGSEP